MTIGRSWQFFLTVALTVALFTWLYYSSDYYADRSSRPPDPPGSAAATPEATGVATPP